MKRSKGEMTIRRERYLFADSSTLSGASAHAAIALPLDRGHCVGGDIHLEGAIFANAALFPFKRNCIPPRRERNAKPPLSVRGKFGCNGVRLGLPEKRRVSERF